MTARGVLQWLVIGSALCVGALFADLQWHSSAQSPAVTAPQNSSAPSTSSTRSTSSTQSTSTPAAAGVPSASTSAAPARPLVFTFWNLQWFPGHKPKPSAQAKAAHVAAVVPVLERLDPDVLGLEEIADEPAAKLLADHLKGFRVDACTQFVRETGEPTGQQTVLCSRLPLLQAWCESWKPAASGVTPRRGFAFGAYQPAPGKVLLVYVLHLKSNREDEPGGAATNIAMREESARQLLAHEQLMTKAYASMGTVLLTVIGGDLNTSLDDPRFEQETTLGSWVSAGFRWAWEGVALNDRLTLPSEGRYPATCFDHVFLRGANAKIQSASLEPTEKTASDHRPVTVRLVF